MLMLTSSANIFWDLIHEPYQTEKFGAVNVIVSPQNLLGMGYCQRILVFSWYM